MGGFILDYAMSKYDRLALFQPVINGLGGNLVAVQASRLSTYMHRLAKLGHIPFGAKSIISPFRAFIGSDINVSTARILLLISIPIHILFVLIIRGIKGSHEFEVTSTFFIFYSMAAFFQVIKAKQSEHHHDKCTNGNLYLLDYFTSLLGLQFGNGSLAQLH